MSHARITLLILAHLGAAGCASQAPIVEAEVVPIGTTTPTSVSERFVIGANEPGPLGPTLAPMPPGSPPTSAGASPSASAPPFRPAPNTTPSAVIRPRPTDRGTLRNNPRIIRGRPLVVDGIAHVAPYVEDAAPAVTDDEIATLERAAREEHASIAAFARTIAELMALGAPLSLLHQTQAALADEIRHTEMTLALLERLTGERRTIDALPAATLPLNGDVHAFFRDVLRGGAIGETLAAADADARAERTPELRTYYETIANDEARHAALAFKTLRWLLATHPELAMTMAEERARLSNEEQLLTAPLFDAL